MLRAAISVSSSRGPSVGAVASGGAGGALRITAARRRRWPSSSSSSSIASSSRAALAASSYDTAERRWSSTAAATNSNPLPSAASPRTTAFQFSTAALLCTQIPTHRHHHHHHSHHQLTQARTAVFVSRHNKSLNVTHDDILAQCRSSNLVSKYNSLGVEPYRSTSTHVILAECPFCPKPTNGRPDNMYKLYVATGSGAYYCHRCGSKGSWFDFCKQIGGAGAGAYDVVDSRGRGASAPGGRQRQQQQQQHAGGYGGGGGYEQQHRPSQRSNGGSNGRRTKYSDCLPMPARSMNTTYQTALEKGETNAAREYLTKERGLSTITLKKYGVGRGHYNFPSTDPNSSAKYVQEECITFPWIMKASEVNEQEELREPPGRFDWSTIVVEEKEEEEEEESSNDAKENKDDGKDKEDKKEEDEKKDEDVEAKQVKEKMSSDIVEGEPPLSKATGPSILRRIKVRSLKHKGHQRLDPPGGGWGLFGWHTVPDDATSIVVTEGEYDAMAVNQATGRPAVSLPNGCRSLPLEVLPLLERFETIYLWMDNDGPGREGAEKFANKLGAKRCLIVIPKPDQVDPTSGKSPKDANDALRMGLDLDAMISAAEIMPHEQLLRFGDFREQVLHEIMNPDKYAGVGVSSLPVFTSIIKGFRRGEMTLLTGPTGSGKTTFLGQLSLDFAEQGINTLWGSFEIKNTRLVSKLLQQYSREPLPIGQLDKLESLRALADRFEELPLHFLKFHGSAEINAVIDAMKYAAYVYDVEHVILDNMQFMISRDHQRAGGSSFDKFEMQDIAIAKFRKFATENNVHVTLVCHPRKEDEGARLGISSVFGSAKATQEADTVLILQNDGKRKYIEVKKNRYDGTLGLAPLHFQRGSGRYTEKPEFDFAGVQETVAAAQKSSPSAPKPIPAKIVARQVTTKAAPAKARKISPSFETEPAAPTAKKEKDKDPFSEILED